MLDIPLIQIPNQSLSTRLDGARYELTFKACGGVMAVDISRDDVVVLTGQRIVCREPLIPYEYLSVQFGNFIFDTENDEVPWWENFGTTHFLLFASAAEIASARAA